jgi:hypothetical protein
LFVRLIITRICSGAPYTSSQRTHTPLKSLIKVVEGNSSDLPVKSLRDTPGDTPVIRNTENKDFFSSNMPIATLLVHLQKSEPG